MDTARPLNLVHRQWTRHVENAANLWTSTAELWSKLWDQKNVELSWTNPLRRSEPRA